MGGTGIIRVLIEMLCVQGGGMISHSDILRLMNVSEKHIIENDATYMSICNGKRFRGKTW